MLPTPPRVPPPKKKAIFVVRGSSLIGKCQNMEIYFLSKCYAKIARWHNLLYTLPTLELIAKFHWIQQDSSPNKKDLKGTLLFVGHFDQWLRLHSHWIFQWCCGIGGKNVAMHFKLRIWWFSSSFRQTVFSLRNGQNKYRSDCKVFNEIFENTWIFCCLWDEFFFRLGPLITVQLAYLNVIYGDNGVIKTQFTN